MVMLAAVCHPSFEEVIGEIVFIEFEIKFRVVDVGREPVKNQSIPDLRCICTVQHQRLCLLSSCRLCKYQHQ